MASLFVTVAALFPAHGSLLYPLPRGGVDRDLAPFNSGGFPAGILSLHQHILYNPKWNTIIAQGVVWAGQSSLRPLSALLCKAQYPKQD